MPQPPLPRRASLRLLRRRPPPTSSIAPLSHCRTACEAPAPDPWCLRTRGAVRAPHVSGGVSDAQGSSTKRAF
eukprot:366199-Chlamydomonas_euryale.AAC.22